MRAVAGLAVLARLGQVAPGTAREHVRVARALRDLPVLHGEFAAARLSYAKVRALTRIADAGNEKDLAGMAVMMTAGQLDRSARAYASDCTPREKNIVAAENLADAMVSICGDYLAGKVTAADNADVYQVILHAGTGTVTGAPRPGTQEAPAGAPAGAPDASAGNAPAG